RCAHDYLPSRHRPPLRGTRRSRGPGRRTRRTEPHHRYARVPADSDRRSDVERRRNGSTRRVHRVACLAGDGLGPELMAAATRALRKVARMHGFAIEDVHAPIGTEALTRWGQPLPAATRSAVLTADAVLVADAAEPALGGLMAQLDLRA